MRSRSAAAWILLFVLGTWGCASAPSAPGGWLALPEELPKDTRGGWIEVTYVGADAARLNVDGELLAIEGGRLYVAAAAGMTSVALDSVAEVRMTVYDADPGVAVGAGVAGVLVTPLVNGWFFVFTAPMWMFGGAGAAAARSRDPVLDEKNAWDEFRPYARFPQGLPPDFGGVRAVPAVAVVPVPEPERPPPRAPRVAPVRAYWVDAAAGLSFVQGQSYTGVGWTLGLNAAYRWVLLGTRLSSARRDNTVPVPPSSGNPETFVSSVHVYDLALLAGLRGTFRGVHATVSGGPAAYAFKYEDLADFRGSWAAQAEFFVFATESLGVGFVGTYNWNDVQDFYVISFGIAVGSP